MVFVLFCFVSFTLMVMLNNTCSTFIVFSLASGVMKKSLFAPM